MVSVSSNFKEVDKLKEFNVVLLQKILPTQKIDPKLQNRKCPEWALNNNKASIKVLFYKNVNIIKKKWANFPSYQLQNWYKEGGSPPKFASVIL